MLLEGIRSDTEALAIRFDRFVSERQLRADGAVAATLDELAARGFVYEAEGARWFRSTDFGDEKDRPLVKSDGEYTYFAADIAYHRDKFARGYDRVIDVWGADHHGHVPRMKAALSALGLDPDRLQVVLVQVVSITRGGEPVRMGKRAGEFVTLREVVDEVGPDATRFFLLMRKSDAQLEFDLDLAKQRTAENPVFYVQYAHARVASLFRAAAEIGLDRATAGAADPSRLTEPEELALVRRARAVSRDRRGQRARARAAPGGVLPGRVGRRSSIATTIAPACSERTRGSPRRDCCLAANVQKVIRVGLGVLGIAAPATM